MKHQTPESMKFRKLVRKLGCRRVLVIGTLELLWIAVQKNAPKGDIGRFTDEEIAVECDWEGDPSLLVDALVHCGWLDRCEEHRLIVHDWKDHAPGWVKRQLARHKHEIIKNPQVSPVTVSSPQTVTGDGLETTNGTPPVTGDCLDPTPNQTKGNPTQPKETPPERPGDLGPPRLPGVGVFPEIPEEVRSEALDSAWKTYCGWVAAFGEGVNEVGMMAKLQELLKRPGGEAKWIKDLEETVCSARVNGKIFDSDRTFGSNGSSPKSSTSNLPEYKRGET